MFEEVEGRFLKGNMSKEINQYAVEATRGQKTRGVETVRNWIKECAERQRANEQLVGDLRDT